MINQFVKILYDEHEVIINAIDAARQMKPLIEKNPEQYASNLVRLIHFFRNYADKYHHYKEEEILFPEMNKRNELLEDGVIKEMFDNHEDFRVMVQYIEKNLNANNLEQADLLLRKYTEELLNHIAVENDEVFQMAESLFNPEELEKIYHRFLDIDRELGDAQKEELKELASDIRKEILMMD